MINAETPVEDFEGALRPALDGREHLVEVEHLEQLGGAQLFDLTDPDLYAWWAARLVDCYECQGADDSPVVVLVDGLTAILAAAGKGPEWYGKWYATFRRLMREIDVPNALVIAHNTLSGSHLMGGTEAQAGADGLWSFSSDDSDRPGSARRFCVVPRLGGVAVPSMVVRLDEDGRLRIATPEPGESPPAEAAEDRVEVVARRTAAYVAEHPGADGQALTDHVDANGWKQLNLKGRARAVELGLIREKSCGSGCTTCERPHHRRRHYWPA